MTTKPEALRLADKYEVEGFLRDHRFAQDHWCRQAALELRRLHAENATLLQQLESIGAGGVEPLRKTNSLEICVPERDLKEAGFDVLVFVPSMDEEDGLVTRGNLVLGGGTVKCSNAPQSPAL